MIEYNDRIFHSLVDRGQALRLEDMSFDSCTFFNCSISRTKERDRRSTVRNVRLRNCEANACNVGPAILEDIEIDGLSTGDLLIIWAATFKHVTLRGDIGKIKINQQAHFVDRTAAVQQPFDDDRVKLYGSIDWALDISRARFAGFDARGIPARLFRIDPESQAVVTRARALQEGWREALSPSNTLWPFMIRQLLAAGDEDVVLVTPLNAPKQRRDDLLHGLQELRRLGVAEPA